MSKLREIAMHDPTVANYLNTYEITEGASWTLTMEKLAIQLAEEKSVLMQKVIQLEETRKAP